MSTHAVSTLQWAFLIQRLAVITVGPSRGPLRRHLACSGVCVRGPAWVFCNFFAYAYNGWISHGRGLQESERELGGGGGGEENKRIYRMERQNERMGNEKRERKSLGQTLQEADRGTLGRKDQDWLTAAAVMHDGMLNQIFFFFLFFNVVVLLLLWNTSLQTQMI